MGEVKIENNKMDTAKNKKGMNLSANKFIKENGMLIALLAVVLIFQILTKGIMLKPLNITNLIQQNGYVLILAVGMLLVVIIGTVDLAVGSVSAFIGAVAGVVMVNKGINPVLSILISIGIGMAVGAIQGYWIAYKEIPGFVVTLAGQLIFRGFTMIILNGKTIAPFPTSFANLGSGFIPPLFYFQAGSQYFVGSSIIIGIILSVVVVAKNYFGRKKLEKYKFNTESKGLYIAKTIISVIVINAATIVLASYKGIPNILVIAGVIIIIYTFITTKTVFGRQVYAVGGNKKAAALSGVKVAKTQFLVFVNMGLMAALAGLAYAARVNSAQPKAGVNFELDALAACYIGGASTSGGTGRVMGAVVGGLVMGVLNNGMSLLGVDNNWQQAIKGFVLLFAVVFDLYSKKKK
ncbi:MULTISPECIES: multiple monosaccharide ABC transporter permease [Clostridium]|jgi:putative multiple sugar transport system permease protein|uniref:Xylose transport system permease protein XylH n=1 Tax=Clostridium butyricum TaxID=1492 RepID=A0A2S7FB31_CLOBU|nr:MULTISPECIES: multiple monosaccharide ABC transporter permease [Clostridium]MDU4853443.1 multiple monosaccharide ABC transporter permease [Clostridioides difficile]ALP91365.1 ABC transporter permease [Clostridium butyricum]ALS17861.1 ABC transporter permease [Clostridium butyricum]ANF14986.1 ABC transporter permease [Clostridium butyricum]AOR94995.1 ABC transporter permease [Clostridium butyricum]